MASFLWSCSEEELPDGGEGKETVVKTVAIVLPMDHGLDLHWRRCLSMFTSNFHRAFKSQDAEVIINYEFYDESGDNLEELAAELAARDDIYAVVGGLYSSNSSLLTSSFTRVGKTFFTLATSEELVRGYASSGYLWAMTETDITQCEVLLAKVVNYGGKRVSLIAKEDDLYGKTFLDWFSFQARELGLDNAGTYSYTPATLETQAKRALDSGADYVICVPSEIEEILPILHSYKAKMAEGDPHTPRLLFSDTGYGADVLSYCGSEAEGMEGVAFGADPESGFDVSYQTYFGIAPTTGEAQLYDAVMLLGYAAWLQHLHPDLSLRDALRRLVEGEDINMGSWMGEDMSLVVDALAQGASPNVRGASGPLKFDKKIYTNVLATTYYAYRIYNGNYVILDYNSSDGGNRTDATLAGWNWKTSEMQEFNTGLSINYMPHESNWALLVATSTDWTNYRHQADVLAIYQQLKACGYPDSRIILIMEDDLALHSQNPTPGEIRVTLGGTNLYDNVKIDYQLSRLTPSDFLAILRGEKSQRLPEVIEATGGDNIFIFWSGHGVPGAMSWNDNPQGLRGDELAETLKIMYENSSYRKLLFMAETCYSGSVMAACTGIPGMLFITAANSDETSKADLFNSEMKVWMTNRFTSTFIEQIAENSHVSMRDLYYRLFINTVGSHVMVYNAYNFGNLYSSDMGEFINFK